MSDVKAVLAEIERRIESHSSHQARLQIWDVSAAYEGALRQVAEYGRKRCLAEEVWLLAVLRQHKVIIQRGDVPEWVMQGVLACYPEPTP